MQLLSARPVAGPRSILGEGPLWDERSQRLWWIDIIGEQLHWLDPANGVTGSSETPEMVGSIFLTEDGSLLAAVPRGVRSVDDWRLRADFHPFDPRTRANDGKTDPDGSIVVGTMGLEEEPGLGKLYRLEVGLQAGPSADRQPDVDVLLSGLTISNGLAWSGDGAALFHIDTPTGRVMSYSYPVLDAGKLVVEIPGAVGFPDGMTIDRDGFLWVALWNGGAIHRYSPSGELDTVVEVGATNVTCCTFGGPDLSELYITTAADHPASQDAAANDAASHTVGAGSLFVCQTDSVGYPPNRVPASGNGARF